MSVEVGLSLNITQVGSACRKSSLVCTNSSVVVLRIRSIEIMIPRSVALSIFITHSHLKLRRIPLLDDTDLLLSLAIIVVVDHLGKEFVISQFLINYFKHFVVLPLLSVHLVSQFNVVFVVFEHAVGVSSEFQVACGLVLWGSFGNGCLDFFVIFGLSLFVRIVVLVLVVFIFVLVSFLVLISLIFVKGVVS